jgi:hypothetical protein
MCFDCTKPPETEVQDFIEEFCIPSNQSYVGDMSIVNVIVVMTFKNIAIY